MTQSRKRLITVPAPKGVKPAVPEPRGLPLNSYPAPWTAMSGANLMSALAELDQRGCGGRFVSVADRDLPTGTEERYSTVIDLAYLRTFSFLVINGGPCPVTAVPQLSPDGAFWGSFGDLSYEIRDSHLFVPTFFLRYARIAYSSATPGCDSVITVWLQGQGL